MKPKYKHLRCCCCGGSAYGVQHWNQDTGYGLGDCCVEFVSRNATQEWVEETYGKAGVNYLVKQVWLGRDLMEDKNYNWVSAWTLVNAEGVVVVQPYFATKAEAVDFTETQGWNLNKGKFDDTI